MSSDGRRPAEIHAEFLGIRHVHEEWTECTHRDGQCCDACHVYEEEM